MCRGEDRAIPVSRAENRRFGLRQTVETPRLLFFIRILGSQLRFQFWRPQAGIPNNDLLFMASDRKTCAVGTEGDAAQFGKRCRQREQRLPIGNIPDFDGRIQFT